VHFINRAAVIIGDGALALVQDQVVVLLVHGTNLPFPFPFANADAAVEIVHHAAKMTDQLGFLGLNHRDELVVVSAAAASSVPAVARTVVHRNHQACVLAAPRDRRRALMLKI
jgi:hypothetical protein